MSVNSKMTALADEIRELSGTTEKIGLDDMTTHVANANTEIDDQTALLEQAIAALEGKTAVGSPAPVLQDKTVTPTTATQEVQPDTGYDGLSKVTVNAMPTATQATPSITVSSAGLITASATQSAGYVASGTKTATKQLTVQAAQTITPGTSNQTIASGRYLTGTQTIKGDANLVAANIAAGVSIFGVTGTHSGGNGGTAAETCTVEIIALAPVTEDIIFSYIDSTGTVASQTCSAIELMTNGVTFTIQANTPIASDTYMSTMMEQIDNVIRINSFCYYITGDATINLEG